MCLKCSPGRASGRQKGNRTTFRVLVLIAFCMGMMAALPCSGQHSDPIYTSGAYTVYADRVVDGAYIARALSRDTLESTYPVKNSTAVSLRRRSLASNLSRYPALQSDFLLGDALYQMSLEEMLHDLRPDGAFNAGHEWQGVWTRDVSYSILLSLAVIEPAAAQESLRRKVRRDRIVQDTGTGGSWPVSSDRVCWSLAAWEVYLVTGDRRWLRESYNIIRNTIHDDEHVVMDKDSGLARGESSFMDWREQTYPRWMQPADIYDSKNIGTNAVYYRTYRIVGMMSRELGEPDQDWDGKAQHLRAAINERLWLPEEKLYGQYLYGRIWQTLSPRTDALGNALAVLFDLPSSGVDANAILAAQPLMSYGVPTVFPETPNIEPYHNRSVWPFVQAFWTLAAAKQHNKAEVLYGIASIYRASALFLTNKENFVLETGSPVGTAINSDSQLWSVAGNLALVYRVLFGMEFAVDGLHLQPVVPRALAGTRTLTNFHYRDSVLSIKVIGFGSHVSKATLDGEPATSTIPAQLHGSHSIVLYLDEKQGTDMRLNLASSVTAPETPVIRVSDGRIKWNAVPNATKYRIILNGQSRGMSEFNELLSKEIDGFGEFQVAAVDTHGVSSFLSEPVTIGGGDVMTWSVVPSGSTLSYISLGQTVQRDLKFDGSIKTLGTYSVSFNYANGNGPINTDSKCAIRMLFVDGVEAGPIVLPQRGKDNWEDWGMSNGLKVQLTPGEHTFELRLEPENVNMDGTVNGARLRSMSAILLP